MDRIAQLAFEQYDDIDNLDGMRITLSNRFDLGLVTGSWSQGASYTIEDWREQLE
jgi:hypothetical protein